MRTCFLLGALALLAGRVSSPAADRVELNGITCLPGEKLACFLLYQPARNQPLNFMLAEGESRFGFKLLEVDGAGHRVRVEKCGVKQYVRIGSAPDLIATAATLVKPAVVAPSRPSLADEQSVAKYLASDDVKRIQSGNPIWPGAAAGAIFGAGKKPNGNQSVASGTSNAGQNVNPGSSNPGQSAGIVANNVADNGNQSAGAEGINNNSGQTAGTDTGNSLQNSGVGANSSPQVVFAGTAIASAASSAVSAAQNSLTDQLWYQESLSFEQSRAQTAADVLAGRMTPFPRTPLTPANTPAPLVSQEVYFANYIPGFHVTGFLDW